jgi:hypothetical protein
MIAIKPLFGAADEEWVVHVGRYMLNMGAVEMGTRLIITNLEGSDQAPIFSKDLSVRLGYLRRRFPRSDAGRHEWAMNVFEVALRHSGFRNIVAHSPIAMSRTPDGKFHIQGILNVTPTDPVNSAQLISLDELKMRVNESAAVARGLLEMQKDFAPAHVG